MKFYIYEHWRPDRDECFYVGKGHGVRANWLRGRNQHHRAIQAKLSRLGMAVEVRMVRTGLSEDEAFTLEIERIAFWRNAGVDLANITNGGRGIARETREAHIAKVTDRRRAPFTEETIAKMRTASAKREVLKKERGYSVDPKVRQQIGLTTSERWSRGEFSRSPESGRPKQRVRCISDGKTFDSIVEAARHYGVSSVAIMRRITGEPMLRKRGLQLQFEAI